MKDLTKLEEFEIWVNALPKSTANVWVPRDFLLEMFAEIKEKKNNEVRDS